MMKCNRWNAVLRPFLASMLFLFSCAALFAQEGVQEEQIQEEQIVEEGLAYISYLVGNVDADRTPDNEREDFEPAELDMNLPIGTLIRTGQEAVCEITLQDGSAIKISSGSVFRIEELQRDGETGKVVEKFRLLAGRVRAKVQKFTTSDSDFSIASGTALAGVRGTSFGVFFDGLQSELFVFEGSVSLESLTNAFEPILVSQGQMSFVPVDGVPGPVSDIPQEVFQEWEKELKKFDEEPLEEEAEEVEPEEVEPEEEKPEGKPKEKEGFLAKFLDLNAYVGTVTMDDQVYARWVFTPELRIGKLGIGLYLPAVFSPDVGIFGFRDWANNDEWDFTDFGDGVHDFLIKFSYISWAERGDPLYIKVGSVDDFYLGHGFIVDNYSNMIYFPEERTVGMQLNVDTDRSGIETMIADFSRFQLFGGRLYVRPMGRQVPLAFGASAVHDRPKPESGAWPLGTTDEDQLPRIVVFGADAEFPIVNLNVFRLKLYIDAAKLGYVYRDVPLPLEDVVDEGSLRFVKGMGTGVGVMGTIIEMFTYRLEYRYILNYYEPGLINTLWENRRLTYQQELQALLIAQDDSSYEDSTTAGFLIQGGVTLFKKLEFGLGYENYKRNTGSDEVGVNKGKMYVNLGKGLVPKVYGSLSYNRNDELEDIFREPFDENTLLDATVFYELASSIALALSYKRTFQYNDEIAEYEPIDSFGISTHFSFF